METDIKKPALRKQIIFDISEEDHKLIKQMAWNNKITMRKWIIKAMAEQIKREERELNDNS